MMSIGGMCLRVVNDVCLDVGTMIPLAYDTTTGHKYYFYGQETHYADHKKNIIEQC